MKFIVNGKPFEFDLDTTNAYAASYEHICEWAGFDPTRILTVVWSTKTGQGTIAPGQSRVLTEGMVFNVADTSNA